MTSVNEDMIRDIYRGLFEREPESDDVVREQSSSGRSLAEILALAVRSAEFRQRHFRRGNGDLLYDGLNSGDEDILRRHLAPGKPDPDFVYNFVGSRQRTTLAAGMASLGGLTYNDIPTVAGDLSLEAVEYVGAIKAVEASRESFVMAELGAGLGSWCTIAGHIARRLGRNPIRLYAVEGSADRAEHIKTNFADNGFDPGQHTIIAAAVGPKDGFALFPKIDVQNDFGGSAVILEKKEFREGFDTVQMITIETLLEREPLIDLIHFDVQGAEADVIDASIRTLNRKVRYMIIGTHARDLETRIRSTLFQNDWILENEQTGRFERAGGKEHLCIDGTQVWRNPAIG